MKNNEIKNMVVPPLRFPEFRDTEGWKEKTLGDVTFNVSKKNKDGVKLPIYSINNKEGFLPQSDQFEGMDSNSRGYDITLYKIIEKNTFAYNPARIDVGSLGYSGDLHNIIISSLYICFKTEEFIEDSFFLQFLKTNNFNQAVKNGTEGGIRNYLFYENFANIKFYLPKNKAEQQKIALCLTSLDELITTQSNKIEALIAHKKGLMQQLFPSDGETVPRLRFAEFRDTERWEIKPFNKIFTRITTKNIENNQNVLTISAQQGLVSQLDFFNKSVSARDVSGYYLLRKGDFAYNKIYSQGYPMGAIKMLKYYDKGVVSTLYICFKANKGYNTTFLEHFFDAGMINSEIEKIAQEGARNHGLLNISVIDFFNNVELLIPVNPEEQQKITNCLSSLDDLIKAESGKLEALKLHKKGLMQQLFPNTKDEVKNE